MLETAKVKFNPVRWDHVQIHDGFWGQRTTVNRERTLPYQYEQCQKTGRLDALKLQWKPGEEEPHIYWDSDVEKWLEAASYTYATHPDEQLLAIINQTVDLLASAQQDDGYLNSHFTTVKPKERWTDLYLMHELYCAGTLMESGVAVFYATGNRKLLDVACRFADYIDTVFGSKEGQCHGYPGHEEIELALIKLYRATNDEKYLNLSKFFVDQRGQSPNYFLEEAKRLGNTRLEYGLQYMQAHAPVREQKEAIGHAVRALYLYSGMADVAAETGDEELFEATKTIWKNMIHRRMYITGGIGSAPQGERITYDYDLPNETAYAETCASVALVFLAHRMLQVEDHAEYADVLEKVLFNGLASGVNLEGDQYFYANPLRSSPSLLQDYQPEHICGHRRPWFGCACCPPNVARLYAALGEYIYAQASEVLYVHQYIASSTSIEMSGTFVGLNMTTRYPWDGTIGVQLDVPEPVTFTLAMRIPGWCSGATMQINNEAVNIGDRLDHGYVKITRQWNPDDEVTLHLPMPILRMHTHPQCRVNHGKVALQRGPMIYCVEEMDCGCDPASLIIPSDVSLVAEHRADLLGGVTVIKGHALHYDPELWDGDLYATDKAEKSPVDFIAIPYCVWANREIGSMSVWLTED